MNSLELDTLLLVKRNLSKSYFWTQGALARNKCGSEVHYHSPHCYSRCLRGEIMFCLYTKRGKEVDPFDLDRVEAYIKEVTGHSDIVEFNDSSSYTEVLKAVNRAIDLVRKECTQQ